MPAENEVVHTFGEKKWSHTQVDIHVTILKENCHICKDSEKTTYYPLKLLLKIHVLSRWGINYNSGFQIMVSRPAAGITWELIRSTKFPGPIPDLLNQKLWSLGPAVCFNKPSRWCWCTLTYENHWVKLMHSRIGRALQECLNCLNNQPHI